MIGTETTDIPIFGPEHLSGRRGVLLKCSGPKFGISVALAPSCFFKCFFELCFVGNIIVVESFMLGTFFVVFLEVSAGLSVRFVGKGQNN